MHKRRWLFLFVLMFSILIVGSVLAQDQIGEINGVSPDEEQVFDDSAEFNDEFKELYEEAEGFDEELEVNAGLTPSSPFYFIDKFFDGFADDSKIRQEKIAEMRVVAGACGEGDQDACDNLKESFERYREHADEFEQEVSPGEKEDAERSSKAIRGVLVREIAKEIPETLKDEYVREIVVKEKNIETAAEIASKIDELCVQLSEIDPLEYSRICKIEGDAPKWRIKLDEELTAEQEKIAREFVSVMTDCFSTSGQDCSCQDIPFPDFADACSIAAPLATACDIDGDESACEKLDDLEMPELPDYLQDIFDEMEGEMSEAQYDMHMPKECVEAGVTSPKECGKIMIQTHAPEECKEALLAANVQSEREGREICDKIMMEIHAPECAEKGITDPEECGEFMMPPECREKGLSPRECRDFMEGFRGEGGPIGMGPRIDFNCQGVDDPLERLDCYDKASSQAKGFGKGFDDGNYDGPCMTESDWKSKKQECRDLYGEHAGDEPIMGDSGEGYQCPIDARCINFGEFKDDFDGPSSDDYPGPYPGDYDGGFDEGYIPGGGGDCGDFPCDYFDGTGNYIGPEGEGPDYDDDHPSDYVDPHPGDHEDDGSYDNSGEGSYSGEGDFESESSESSGGDEDFGSSDSESSENDGDSEGDGGAAITGGVIGASDNRFLNYWFERLF